MQQMYVDNSAASSFKWPVNGFLKLSGMLFPAELLDFPHRDHNGDPCHYVIMNSQTPDEWHMLWPPDEFPVAHPQILC